MPKRLLVTTGLMCLTTIVSHSLGRSTLGLLLPAIEDDLSLTHAQAGRPGTGLYLAYVVGVLLVALVAPRVEPITILRTGLAVACTGLVISTLAPNLLWLTVGVSLTGGAGAGIWLTAPVLATTYVPVERRGLVIALLSSSIGFANIALGFGTTALRSVTGNELVWRPIWAAGALFTASLLGAILILARFDRTTKITGGFSLDELRAVPNWVRVTLAYALFGAMSAGYGAFILVALEEHDGLSRGQATAMFSVMGIVGMLMTPVVGALSDRHGRKPFLVGAMAALTVANLMVASGIRPVAVAGGVLFGASVGSFPAQVATYVRDHVSDRAFSKVLATMTILFSAVAALVPSGIGALADATGSFGIPYVVLGLMAASSMMLVAGVAPKAAS